jgi:hypothetical protein
MKATLFVIENDADHAQALALVDKLMGSCDGYVGLVFYGSEYFRAL